MLARETFNRIKDIKAVNGQVKIEVYSKEPDEAGAKKLETQLLTIREAARRASALNRVLHKFPKKDSAIAYEIVEKTIAACREAQRQCRDKNIDPDNPVLARDQSWNEKTGPGAVISERQKPQAQSSP